MFFQIFAYKFALAFLPKEDKKTTGLVPFKTGSLRYSLITPTERVNPAKTRENAAWNWMTRVNYMNLRSLKLSKNLYGKVILICEKRKN